MSCHLSSAHQRAAQQQDDVLPSNILHHHHTSLPPALQIKQMRSLSESYCGKIWQVTSWEYSGQLYFQILPVFSPILRRSCSLCSCTVDEVSYWSDTILPEHSYWQAQICSLSCIPIGGGGGQTESQFLNTIEMLLAVKTLYKWRCCTLQNGKYFSDVLIKNCFTWIILSFSRYLCYVTFCIMRDK